MILLDVNMPDIDGIETAELIRQHSKTAHTPIIFVTAYADEMQTARGYAARRGGLHPVADRPGDPAQQGAGIRRSVPRAAARAQRSPAPKPSARPPQEATRRSEFLAVASRELGASLDLDEGMERLLQMLVPGLARVCAALGRGSTTSCSPWLRRSERQGRRHAGLDGSTNLPDALAARDRAGTRSPAAEPSCKSTAAGVVPAQVALLRGSSR